MTMVFRSLCEIHRINFPGLGFGMEYSSSLIRKWQVHPALAQDGPRRKCPFPADELTLSVFSRLLWLSVSMKMKSFMQPEQLALAFSQEPPYLFCYFMPFPTALPYRFFMVYANSKWHLAVVHILTTLLRALLVYWLSGPCLPMTVLWDASSLAGWLTTTCSKFSRFPLPTDAASFQKWGAPTWPTHCWSVVPPGALVSFLLQGPL